jgi:hypothetical protein
LIDTSRDIAHARERERDGNIRSIGLFPVTFFVSSPSSSSPSRLRRFVGSFVRGDRTEVPSFAHGEKVHIAAGGDGLL